MTVCDPIGHEAIVYEGRNCPLCDALQEIAELKVEVERLENANA